MRQNVCFSVVYLLYSQVNEHIENGILQKDMFKIVYVAPMKALAQEVRCLFAKIPPNAS